MSTVSVGNIRSVDGLPPNFISNSGVRNGWVPRAFVRFDASSGTPTIVKAANVSSISDLGVGYYSINFVTPMPDTNYAVKGSYGNPLYIQYEQMFDYPNGNYEAPTRTYYKVTYHGQGAFRDPQAVMHVVFSN